MPKLSKELESLLLSLDKVEPIYERLPDFSPLPFNDTLFIFRRALGGRLRISSDNYVII